MKDDSLVSGAPSIHTVLKLHCHLSPLVLVSAYVSLGVNMSAVYSQRFYQGLLVARANKQETQSLEGWEELPNQKDCPLMFYGVSGHHARESDALSYYNQAEVAVVASLVQKLLESSKCAVTPLDIGIIAPFRKQVYKIRSLLREKGLGMIRVGTVDDYQGQEEKIIFISTVVGRNQAVGSEMHQLQNQGV